ncbi:MAG: J domain-containing protein [Lachnospiraceae bacterium]|nr:J domain-containing protein [Lachnospiraceae bacterium]
MAKRDYYEALGIQKGAEEKAIKQAYRKLAKRYHPDTNPGDVQAEQRFKEITEAYNVLSDKEKRKLYDRFGHAAFDGSMGPDPYETARSYENAKAYRESRDFQGTGSYQKGSSGFHEYHFEGGDMEDLFGDLFGQRFHGRYQEGFQSGGQSRKGHDLEAEFTISFEEAAFGCDKVIQLQDGGMHSLKVHIPAGIDDGKKIRLQGKGADSRSGGVSGDLYLKIHVLEKPGYERRGMDVYTTVSIPYTTAVLGGEAQVQTIHGNVKCKIPAGTQCGSKIRLRGKGIVSMKNPSVYGDAYITIQIQVPRKVSSRERELLQQYQTQQQA